MIRNPTEVSPNNTTVTTVGDSIATIKYSIKAQTTGDKIVRAYFECYDATYSWGSGKIVTNSDGWNNGDTISAVSYESTSLALNNSIYWNVGLYSDIPNNLVRSFCIYRVVDKNKIYMQYDSTFDYDGDDGSGYKCTYALKFRGEKINVKKIYKSTVLGVECRAFVLEKDFSDDNLPVASQYIDIYTNYLKSETYNFFVSSLPSISFVDFSEGKILTIPSYTFRGQYSQAENVPIKYYTFNLYNNKEKLIDTSDIIYSSEIKHTVDNFLNGDYRIELIIVNQKNVTVSTSVNFSVSIAMKEVEYSLDLDFQEEEGCARVRWPAYKSLTGTISPEGTALSYVENTYNDYKSVQIPTNTTVSYSDINGSNLEINKESVIMYSGVLKESGTILQFDFTHDYFISGEGTGSFSILLEDSQFYAYIEIVDKDGNNLRTKQRLIKKLFPLDASCFSTTLIPAESRIYNYILNTNELWDNTKYFITNEKTDTPTSSQHYKIHIIPYLALDTVMEDTSVIEGIYIENVSDLDPE